MPFRPTSLPRSPQDISHTAHRHNPKPHTSLFGKEILDALHHSLAPSTRSNYRSAKKHFLAFCDAKNVPHRLRFPADETVLCAFAASHARKFSGQTAANRIAGLKTYHALSNMPWHGGPRLTYVLRGVSNLAPSSSQKPPRPPISCEMIEYLHDNLNLDLPHDAAVFAVAAVCFWGQCRLGELLASSRRNLTNPNLPTIASLKPPNSSNGSRELHLPRTKTNQKNGQTITLTRQARRADPLRAIALLLQANGKQPPRSNLFVYRSTPDGEFRSLTKESFVAKCNEVWSNAGFPRVTGHCFRIGGTTELLKRGIKADLVKAMGRWKSNAFHVYWRSIGAIAAQHAEFLQEPRPSAKTRHPHSRDPRSRQRLASRRRL